MGGVVVEVPHERSLWSAAGRGRDFSCRASEAPLAFGRSSMSVSETLLYKRATFATQLPVGSLYSPSHCWMARREGRRWRVGYTKFALRMLGELVDVQFEPAPGAGVAAGDIVGSIEGFKALSDIYCVGAGTFAGGNAALKHDLESIAREPYGAGWLYEFEGDPDDRAMSVENYRGLLDVTIDRILAKQKDDESPS